jgi:hypothetical protein
MSPSSVEMSTMPSSKIICPDCKAVLKPPKPVPDGKRVVCPRCKNAFTTPGAVDEVEEVQEVQPAGKKAAAKKAPAGKAPAGKPSAPPPPPPHEEEDESAGTYGVVKEKEDEEDDEENEAKKRISYEPDLSIKDLRGPAQAAIVAPSNGLMVAGTIAILILIVRIGVATWPFMFAPSVVDHKRFFWDYYQEKAKAESDDKARQKLTQRAENIPERKDLKDDEKKALEEEIVAQVWARSIWASAAFLMIIWNAIMIVGAVKMQNVESYGWSMAACIMGIFPFSFWLVSLPYGIVGLLALRKPSTIAGFYYRPD